MEPWLKGWMATFRFDDKNSGYSHGKEFWKASTLYKAAKDQKCRPYRLPIKHMDLSGDRWRGLRPLDMAGIVKRILKADTSIPIIISPSGSILDGYHRIVKAIIDGRSYVMAMRLIDMPTPDDTNYKRA